MKNINNRDGYVNMMLIKNDPFFLFFIFIIAILDCLNQDMRFSCTILSRASQLR